jgi:hypothetical protein
MTVIETQEDVEMLRRMILQALAAAIIIAGAAAFYADGAIPTASAAALFSHDDD